MEEEEELSWAVNLEIFFLSRVSRVKLGLLAGCQLREEDLPHGYSKSEPVSFSPFSSI
jgi:hypothetical protein